MSGRRARSCGARVGLLGDVPLAARMAALTGDLGCILVRLAVGAAVLLIRHAGTGRVSAFLSISHESYLLRDSGLGILRVGCRIALCLWQAPAQMPQL